MNPGIERGILIIFIICCAVTCLGSVKPFIYMTGRHVCARQKSNYEMYPVQKSYCIPKLQTFLYKCNSHRANSGICTGYRTIYTILKRNVYQKAKRSKVEFTCCPGWARDYGKRGCSKPVCNKGCQNGGVCIKPGVCKCPSGWTGSSCHQDIDECQINNGGCQQKCTNLEGAFKCLCADQFTLKEDGKSCEMCLTCNPEWQEMNLRLQALEQITFKVTEQLTDVTEQLTTSTKSQQEQNTDISLDERTKQFQSSEHVKESPPGQDAVGTLQVLGTLVDKVALLESKLQQCVCNADILNSVARHPEDTPESTTKTTKSKA